MENERAQTVIAADIEITGSIKGSGVVRIEGKFDGELQCEKEALIGKSASVKGNVSAGSVVVEGAVQGNITAKDRIELKSSARLTGDIKAKRLVVEEGVLFVGRSEVNPAGGPPSAAAAMPAEDASPAKSAAAPSADATGRAGLFKR